MDAKFTIDKAHQPGGANQQKLYVFKKRWLCALNMMANKLPNPENDEANQRGYPQGSGIDLFINSE